MSNELIVREVSMSGEQNSVIVIGHVDGDRSKCR